MFSTAERFYADLLSFDADLYTGSECAAIAEKMAVIGKACSAVGVIAAARAVREQAHRERGFTDGERWLAQQSGTTRHDARRALETAGRLGDCPDTKQALLAGQVSLAQAGENIITQRESLIGQGSAQQPSRSSFTEEPRFARGFGV
jgi:hypothetical protein